MCSLAGDIPPLSPPPDPATARPPTVGVYAARVCQPLWICNLPFQFLASPFHRSSKKAVSANFTVPFHSQHDICMREITKPNTVWLSSEGHALLFMLNRCENARAIFFFLLYECGVWNSRLNSKSVHLLEQRFFHAVWPFVHMQTDLLGR